jgi:choline dehydrogenase
MKYLVLEAGRKDSWWDLYIQMPAALTFPIGSKFYDWMYETDPEPYMGGRKVYQGRGKILGGSGSINGMIFQRGNPMDYERWAADKGMENWDFAHCLPYFKKMENATGVPNDKKYRGHDGPLYLEKGPAKNPLFKAFFDAAVAAGLSALKMLMATAKKALVRLIRTLRTVVVGLRQLHTFTR